MHQFSYLTDSPAILPPRVKDESRYLTDPESMLDLPRVPMELSRVRRKVAEVGVAFKLPKRYPLDLSRFMLTRLTLSVTLERVATRPVAILSTKIFFRSLKRVGRRPKRHCSFSTWKSSLEQLKRVANKELTAELIIVKYTGKHQL